MKAPVLFLLPFVVLPLHWEFSLAAGGEELSGLPEITRAELDAIAGRLGSLASSGALEHLAGRIDSEDTDVDLDFVQKALGMLGELLSSPESRELLADSSQDPEQVLHTLLKTQGGEDEEALQAILLYFFSLRRVLQGNDYLRNQVSSLIQKNAEKLLVEGNFGQVLGDIATSDVFHDLKEEVEEDMQNKTGYIHVPDTGDDMSR